MEKNGQQTLDNILIFIRFLFQIPEGLQLISFQVIADIN